MHLAKGLEFRAVAVMACDDEVIPLQERIEKVTEDSDLRKFTTPNGTCYTSPAPERGIICSSRALNRHRSFSMTLVFC